MSEPIKILVYGPPKHGKTASLRGLPPDNTGIINCDRKELSGSMNHGYKMVTTDDGGPRRPGFFQTTKI